MNYTITKIKDAEPMGEYKPTAIDERKKTADFLLRQVSPFIIRWVRSGSVEKVSRRKLEQLQKTYRWEVDF